MAFLDWIPVASTIKHAFQNPKGIRVSDYTCTMNNAACASGDAPTISAAKLTCERDIDAQLIKNIQAYVGSIPDAIMHDAVGDIAGIVIAYLIKRSIKAAAGLSIPAVGVVLGIDSFVDMGIVISTINRMKTAADRAKVICCKCAEAACSNAKQNTGLLEIVRWYWGPERSFDETKKEAQDAADKAYSCNGSCTTGTCKPKMYVINWSQGGFGMTRTKIKYDVYCECY